VPVPEILAGRIPEILAGFRKAARARKPVNQPSLGGTREWAGAWAGGGLQTFGSRRAPLRLLVAREFDRVAESQPESTRCLG